MVIKECIILAGGMGTRLRTEVPDLPKCLAPVAGKPFLYWVIRYLQSQGVETFVFSLGYLHEMIEAFVAGEFPSIEAKFSVEKTAKGTGGAIQLSLEKCSGQDVLATNGDTLFEADLARLARCHFENGSVCTLALKPVHDVNRYGAVEIDAQQTIVAFTEKKHIDAGLINGGIYIINRQAFESTPLPPVFSFENDYLAKFFGAKKMTGLADDGYFIDIGIPEDFQKAHSEIKEKYATTDRANQ